MESTPASPSGASLLLTARNLDRAGFAHGFSLRPLDFGPRAAQAARAGDVGAVARALGFSPDELRQVNQVHGATVVRADALEDAAARADADALVADVEGGTRAVAVRVADCVPVLVADRRIGSVAAIHAGWRGVVAGVVAAAMEELARIGSGDWVAAIGPCIGACCFEVDDAVAERIAAAAPDARVVVRRAAGKALVDLRAAVRAQLAALGAVDVEDVAGCTKCDPLRFHSFRRDAEASGRHLAVIVTRSGAPLSRSSIPVG